MLLVTSAVGLMCVMHGMLRYVHDVSDASNVCGVRMCGCVWVGVTCVMCVTCVTCVTCVACVTCATCGVWFVWCDVVVVIVVCYVVVVHVFVGAVAVVVMTFL